MAQGQTLPIALFNGFRTCKTRFAGKGARVIYPSIADNQNRDDNTTGISDNYCYGDDDAAAKTSS